MKTKNIFMVLVSCLSFLLLTGCAEGQELHQKLIIQGIGIDNSESGYSLTVQALDFKNPANEDEPNIKNIEVEGTSLVSALENISKKTSLTPVYSQNLIIIIGESIAKTGVNKFMDFFVRHCEARPKVKLCVVEDKASEYFKIKHNNKLIKAKDIHDLIPDALNSDILHFVSNLKNKISDPYLACLSTEKSESEKNIILKGVAVFSNETLKNYLYDNDFLGFMILKGVPECGTCKIHDENLGQITCSVNKVEARTEVINDEYELPLFDINLKIKASAFSIDNKFDTCFDENLKNSIAEKLSKKITDICYAVIYKTTDMKTDILNLGRTLKNSNPEKFKKIENEWSQNLSKCRYNLSANTDVIITGKEPV